MFGMLGCAEECTSAIAGARKISQFPVDWVDCRRQIELVLLKTNSSENTMQPTNFLHDC
jgi:hypothetical protein